MFPSKVTNMTYGSFYIGTAVDIVRRYERFMKDGAKMDLVDLGMRVRKQRNANGWSQEKLAEQIGVSTSFIGHIERGSRIASLETMVALSNALAVSLDYLMASSLTGNSLGPVPQNLTRNQRLALQDILSTIQIHIGDWNKPNKPNK